MAFTLAPGALLESLLTAQLMDGITEESSDKKPTAGTGQVMVLGIDHIVLQARGEIFGGGESVAELSNFVGDGCREQCYHVLQLGATVGVDAGIGESVSCFYEEPHLFEGEPERFHLLDQQKTS